MQFPAQDLGLGREGESELDGLDSHFDHRDFDIVVDDDRFTDLARQEQHRTWSPPTRRSSEKTLPIRAAANKRSPAGARLVARGCHNAAGLIRLKARGP